MAASKMGKTLRSKAAEAPPPCLFRFFISTPRVRFVAELRRGRRRGRRRRAPPPPAPSWLPIPAPSSLLVAVGRGGWGEDVIAGGGRGGKEGGLGWGKNMTSGPEGIFDLLHCLALLLNQKLIFY
uniref:Uncharacterized protein n=1 Tax=Oryza nivara TaxID=4536 RepID=A0A0E0H7C1_ORYNI